MQELEATAAAKEDSDRAMQAFQRIVDSANYTQVAQIWARICTSGAFIIKSSDTALQAYHYMRGEFPEGQFVIPAIIRDTVQSDVECDGLDSN